MKTTKNIDEKIKKLKNELMAMDYILRGTINKKYLKCGKKECICHKDSDKLHGPYYLFTKKIKGKTVGKLYSKKEADFLNVYLKKYNYIIDVIRRISDLSDQAVQLLLKQVKPKGKTGNDKNRT
jgi:hypothetical protein